MKPLCILLLCVLPSCTTYRIVPVESLPTEHRFVGQPLTVTTEKGKTETMRPPLWAPNRQKVRFVYENGQVGYLEGDLAFTILDNLMVVESSRTTKDQVTRVGLREIAFLDFDKRGTVGLVVAVTLSVVALGAVWWCGEIAGNLHTSCNPFKRYDEL